MKNECIPNFFVVGAQKSGTTTIYALMRQHPELFLPELKESHYFSLPAPDHIFSDLAAERMNQTAVRSFEAYQALFKNAGPQLRGEVCPTYLYPEFSAKRISKAVPDAKIVIMLRNPVDRSFSAYRHMKARGAEKASTFDEALALETAHIDDGWQDMGHYSRASRYFEQVKRYYDCFSSERIYITKFDDFVKDPISETNKVLEFLGVSPLPPTATIRQTNKTHVIENGFLKNALANRRYGIETLRKLLPSRYRGQLKEWLMNQLAAKPEKITDATRETLKASFLSDIENLEKLTKISFNDWK